jgi:hypothetical protein
MTREDFKQFIPEKLVPKLRNCRIHLSVVCCRRAVPLLWRVLEQGRATVAFQEYQPL